LTLNDINIFIQVDKLKILIVEVINESAYGFNLSKKVEKAAAIKVVTDENDFTVVGWSISKIIPNWVKTFDEWNIYICDQGTNFGNSNIVNHQMFGSEVGLEQHFDTREDNVFDNLADEIKGTNGKVYHNPYLKVQNERNSDGCLKQNVKTGEKDLFENLSDEIEGTNGKVYHNPYLKVQNGRNSSTSIVKTKFDGNADMFDVCGDDLKIEVSTYITKANKSEPIDADVCGPFMNSKSGQSSYVVIFGVLKKAWTLKPLFLRGYLGTLVKKLNTRSDTSINIEHCETYYEFNIKKIEFGNESLWLRLPPKNGKPGNTIKRLSFVLSFDGTADSAQGLEMVKDALEFLAFTMKKRETGPVGGLLLNYLKDHAEGLYRHVTERHPSSYSAEETLTNDIDAQFQGGFTINTNARLNRFMVDYDIIRVLKNHVGYKSWDEVSSTEREYCFKNYSPKSGLPMWNTIQENYA
jgi:hypothetical protein